MDKLMSKSRPSSGCNYPFFERRTMANGVFLVVSSPQRAEPRSAAMDAYSQIGDALLSEPLEIVQERILGSLSVEPLVKDARREARQVRGLPADGPVTYVQGRPTWGEGFGGVIVHAVPRGQGNDQVRLVLDGAEPRGRTWCADGTRFIILQNIQGLTADADNAPESQARRAIDRADRLLQDNGSGYRDTVRTWFYLSDILGWYAEFNQARTARYGQFGLLSGPDAPEPRLPASTGIRADMPGGAACALDLLAVIDSGGTGPSVRHIRNPRQQEAFRYGSAFSRCAVIHGQRENLIQVSGTAAIDEAGKSLHPGDVRAQACCTLDKVAALMEQAGASLEDICAATIFLKNGDDAPAVRQVLADRGLEHLPAVWAVADVCRDELLFEIDAEAVTAS
jgi:enamine deaminase RidA (YjgF/YER057c/UK114 family)